jgi:hypothetical protein
MSRYYILKGMDWNSGKIIQDHLKENGWELTGKIGVGLFYKNPKTNHYATLIDFTGSEYSKKLKNLLSIVDNLEVVHGLIKKLTGKTNIKLVS